MDIKMNRVVKILMKRDRITKAEAEKRLAECRRLCDQCLAVGDYAGVENTIASELGLELDYVFEVLG